MEQGERQVENRPVGNPDPGDGREDDQGVPKNHREDEAEADGMERRIAPGVAGDESAGQPEQAGGEQPEITGEQAGSDKAGQARGRNIAAGDVVAQKPERQGDQTAGE